MRARARTVVAIGAVLAVALVVAPPLVARHYAQGPGAASVGALRVDAGWRFAYDAVRLARGAELGHHDAALARAEDVWPGPPKAEGVDLVYLDDRPFAVPVPPGGTAPRVDDAVARPRSRLGWVVTGSVRGGPEQMIGLLDFQSGDVVWNIRPLPPVRA